MCPAIHINSRSWLRSSSTHEPSDPPLRVISQIFRRHSRATIRQSARAFTPQGGDQSLTITNNSNKKKDNKRKPVRATARNAGASQGWEPQTGEDPRFERFFKPRRKSFPQVCFRPGTGTQTVKVSDETGPPGRHGVAIRGPPSALQVPVGDERSRETPVQQPTPHL